MREYQVQGLNWMCGLHYNGINGILADEMVSQSTFVLRLSCIANMLYALSRVSVKLFKRFHSSVTSNSTKVFTVLI